MKGLAYYNGVFGSREDISIPLSDRSIFFGDGIYDAAIGKNGKVFLLEEHVDRLLGNAKRLGIPCALTKEKLSELLTECAQRSGIEHFFLYFQLTRNSAARTHSALNANGSNLLITVDPFALPNPSKRISLITAQDLRYYYCDIKTLNLLPAVIASTEAEKSGAYEAVFLRGDTVTECAHSNISILKDGILYTHPTNNLILPGITRKHLLMACDALGIEYKEIPFSKSDLFAADEVVVTSTSKLCLFADNIDEIAVGGKDIPTAKAISDYMLGEFVHYYL